METRILLYFNPNSLKTLNQFRGILMKDTFM